MPALPPTESTRQKAGSPEWSSIEDAQVSNVSPDSEWPEAVTLDTREDELHAEVGYVTTPAMWASIMAILAFTVMIFVVLWLQNMRITELSQSLVQSNSSAARQIAWVYSNLDQRAIKECHDGCTSAEVARVQEEIRVMRSALDAVEHRILGAQRAQQ